MTIDWVLRAIIVLLLFKPTTSWANEIYINQVGDNLNMEVVQDGEDNYFQYCAVNNDSNCTDMNGNAHGWADGVASDNAEVNSSTVGDDNTVVVAHATGQNNTNENITNIDIIGDRNKAQSIFANASYGNGSGGVKQTNIEIYGDDNIVKHGSDSYGNVEANVSVTGDDNSVQVYQRSKNNIANIDVTNAGGAVSVNLQQLGSSWQDTAQNSFSLTQICTNANGCAVNVTQN